MMQYKGIPFSQYARFSIILEFTIFILQPGGAYIRQNERRFVRVHMSAPILNNSTLGQHLVRVCHLNFRVFHIELGAEMMFSLLNLRLDAVL
jgi:hypothetical protein